MTTRSSGSWKLIRNDDDKVTGEPTPTVARIARALNLCTLFSAVVPQDSAPTTVTFVDLPRIH